MWEEVAVVRISLSPPDAGPGELLLMKLVSVTSKCVRGVKRGALNFRLPYLYHL